MQIGSLVDTLALTPSLFSHLFIVTELPRLGDTLQAAVNNMTPDEDLLDQIMSSGFQSNWKRATHEEKTLPQVTAYFEKLKEAEGKTIITQEEYDLALYRATKIQQGLAQIIEGTYQTQVPIYWQHRDLECKGLIDILEESGDFISLYDLKITSYPLHLFYKQARALRMDLQQSFYYYGAQKVFSGKHVMRPYLLPYSTVDEALGDPIQLTEQDLMIGANGAFIQTSVKVPHSPEIIQTKRLFGFNQGLTATGLVDKLDLDFLHRQDYEGNYQTGIWF